MFQAQVEIVSLLFLSACYVIIENFFSDVTDVCVDEENKLVTTPAYMYNGAFHEIHDGVVKMVEKVLELSEWRCDKVISATFKQYPHTSGVPIKVPEFDKENLCLENFVIEMIGNQLTKWKYLKYWGAPKWAIVILHPPPSTLAYTF